MRWPWNSKREVTIRVLAIHTHPRGDMAQVEVDVYNEGPTTFWVKPKDDVIVVRG